MLNRGPTIIWSQGDNEIAPMNQSIFRTARPKKEAESRKNG